MKTDLDHLTQTRQRQLQAIVGTLLEEFENATTRGTQDFTRSARILKIILFGSFARGDWVDDRKSGYLSDYDILVVVNHPKLTDKVDYWEAAEDRFLRDALRKPHFPEVGLIVHDYADVNDQLARGRPFFRDLVREGIVLYEAEGFPFAVPQILPPEVVRAEATSNFEGWFPRVSDGLDIARWCAKEGKIKDAAFMAHQTAERAYTCVLLTHTLYCPKSHNLTFLRNRAEGLVPELRPAWPRADRIGRRRFTLIKRAYVEARYSPHYRITDEELTWSFARLEVLRGLVQSACERHLAALATPA